MNIGIIGLNRGTLLYEYSKLNSEVQITAICDLNFELMRSFPSSIYKTSNYKEEEFVKNIEAVYIATPPESHADISIYFLNKNISVLCEVPACLDENEAERLLEAERNSSAIYMMAENYCYIPENLAIKEIIQSGKLGAIVYVEGKYIHDCKELLTQNGELTWRGKWNIGTRLNHYPTHSFGPICQWLGIGDKKGDFIVSIKNSKSSNKSLKEYWFDNNIHEKITQADIIFSEIKTENGITIHLRYDTKSNRPHLKNGYEIQGTKGWIQSGRYDEEAPILYLKDEERIFSLRERSEYKQELIKLPYSYFEYGRTSINYSLFLDFIVSIQNNKSSISVEDSILWSSPIWS